MRRQLVNLNPTQVAEDSRYVMQITGDDNVGKQELDNFIDPEMRYPVIATTSKLLSTGVDAQTVKIIVLDSKVESMTEFKQMIGRGSRVREDYGKWFFVILDFRNVTKLFEDKAFDGDPVKVIEASDDTDMDEIIEDLDDVDETDDDEDDDGPHVILPGPRSPRKKRLIVSGQTVNIVGETVELVGADGKAITTNLGQFTKDELLKRYPSAIDFVTAWRDAPSKADLLDQLGDEGIPLEDLVEQRDPALDPFDVGLDVVYANPPFYPSRGDRAARPNVAAFAQRYTAEQRQLVDGLLAKYVEAGVRSIEDIGVLRVAPISSIGSPMEIIRLFGSREAYESVVTSLINELYQETTS